MQGAASCQSRYKKGADGGADMEAHRWYRGGAEVVRCRSCRVAELKKLQTCRCAELKSCRVAELQRYRSAEVQMQVQRCRGAEVVQVQVQVQVLKKSTIGDKIYLLDL